MLTGNLVRLRPHALSDLDDYWRWANDHEVTRWWTADLLYPQSHAAVGEWLERAIHQTKPPTISLAIETSDGRYIGNIGLGRFRLEDACATFWILIGEKDCWSHGYGTDATRTLLRFAFDELNLHRVHLNVDDDNSRAIACYRKCGFVEEGRTREDRFKGGSYHDSLVMGVLAREFRALHPAEAPA